MKPNPTFAEWFTTANFKSAEVRAAADRYRIKSSRGGNCEPERLAAKTVIHRLAGLVRRNRIAEAGNLRR